MSDQTITCPNCKTEIKLTESLAAPLLEATRKEFERKIVQKETDIAKREKAIREAHSDLERVKENIETEVAAKLKIERSRIAEEEGKKAKLLAATDLDQKAKEIADLRQVLKDRDVKLSEAQNAQAELIRKQRELDDAKREMDLTIEKRIQASLATVQIKAKQEGEEGMRLKVVEKEQQIASMQRQIEDLKRKAEQGSQQLQGEAQEAELESILNSKFPQDIIEPVPKGEFGGDLLHRVIGPLGQHCGTILWESKRTKNWSDAWLSKLRGDQRAAKAEIALIVSDALPKGLTTFDLIEGVWVAEPKCAIPIAVALRHALIELNTARQAGEGQQTKMEQVYRYLTGPGFRHRIEAIAEKITEMQDDLERERRAITRMWAKREAQINGVIESTAGMFGDLQGIAGKAIGEIEALSLPMIGSSESDATDGAQ
jgi:hypothetical protein